MVGWLLLGLTVVFAYLTYDALSHAKALRRGPFSMIASTWKNGPSPLANTERNDVKQRHAHGFANDIGPLLLVMTIILGVATVRTFFS